MDTRNVISLVATVRGKANRSLKAQLRAAGLAEIDPAYGSILAQLYRHGECTMMELAHATRRDKSTVTALVGRLETLGYVARRRNPEDGRSWCIRLTDRGEELRGPFGALSQALLRQAFAGFSEGEKETLVGLLEKMSRNL